MKDDRVCKTCEALEGYTWAFTDTVPDSLTHPAFGEVWNTTQGSGAHGHSGTCRCHLEPVFDLADLLGALKHLRDELKQAATPQ